ncbi:MAG: hypothetical protein EXR07_07770 [Acetobacteraceae bacterium]|nr:hypothetical protein [Acetobacteraceae bacterium]
MAINIGARRAAKNQRRKVVVAEKRKAEMLASGTASQVRMALAHPIQHCLLSEGLFDSGMGILVVARGATPASVTMATFLLDTFALGAKDVFFRSLSAREFAQHVDHMSITSPMVPVDPAYARKLLNDLVAWARGLGVAPHRDYVKVEPIFGAVKAEARDVQFPFGFGGKPLFMGDESDIARRLTRPSGGVTTDARPEAPITAALENAGSEEPRAGLG